MGSFYSGGGENGTFSLSYNTLYERPSSLAIISGIWLGQNSTFNISSSGTISGSDVFGCQYGGQFSIINSSFNAYKLAVTVTQCGAADGSYSGLATLSDSITTNDTMTVGISSTSLSIVTKLTR